MKTNYTVKLLLALPALAALTGCASFVDSLNKTHQKVVESSQDSPIALHKENVKPIPASSFEREPPAE